MAIQDWQRDTIVAPATPPGEGGIGVIRISGPQAPAVIQPLWKGKTSLTQFKSHKLYKGDFFTPDSKEKLDTGLLVWMRAPHSFTGEEVLELHLHGGPFIMHRVLEACLAQGARLAEPGEFSRRAFLNGKVDLLQAEAIGEMIHAKCEKALANANSQLEGRLSAEVETLRDELIDLLAQVEAAIDFPDEDIEIIQPPVLKEKIIIIDKKLQDWLQRFQIGRLIREGIRVALVGRPNVGKSSLLNRLIGEDKAIVHDSPGTTRDVVEGFFQMEGLAWQLFDTAGMRLSDESVEQEGILRSQKMAMQVDLTLWLLDVSQEMTDEDREVISKLRKPVLVVGNKADLPQKALKFPKAWQGLPDWASLQWILISAKTGLGIEKLKQTMLAQVGLSTLGEKSHAYLNNARHREALQQSLEALKKAKEALDLPAECLAADLRLAAGALESLLGKIDQEEVLDKIFSQFCLGK